MLCILTSHRRWPAHIIYLERKIAYRKQIERGERAKPVQASKAPKQTVFLTHRFSRKGLKMTDKVDKPSLCEIRCLLYVKLTWCFFFWGCMPQDISLLDVRDRRGLCSKGFCYSHHQTLAWGVRYCTVGVQTPTRVEGRRAICGRRLSDDT